MTNTISKIISLTASESEKNLRKAFKFPKDLTKGSHEEQQLIDYLLEELQGMVGNCNSGGAFEVVKNLHDSDLKNLIALYWKAIKSGIGFMDGVSYGDAVDAFCKAIVASDGGDDLVRYLVGILKDVALMLEVESPEIPLFLIR